uniref:Uncharacterized protein n=2 Tax=Nicotiana TaxID=4085 RepID=A0A1S3ZQ70_TOBAC|nr:PREDICTED: uncharacterized protein LOC104213739 [Nicotiana sylvestris]XP_016466526.1 PREDICTED: uncharacterized protein LOC107789267 [Nicotiana tabacum]
MSKVGFDRHTGLLEAPRLFEYNFNVDVSDIVSSTGNSANLIKLRVVEHLERLYQIVPASRVLNGFNMASETTKGEIILPAVDTQYEGSSINLHQMIKFPTNDGVKAVYGEQHATRELFAVHDMAPASTPSASKKPKDK